MSPSIFICCLSLLATCLTFQPSLGDEVRPMMKTMPPRKTPLNMYASQWQKLLKKLEPRLDYEPRGTKTVPEYAGKIHAVNSHIVGGDVASSGQFPWQVALVADLGWFCGGSLIYNNWVLTAAHCIGKANSFQLTVGAIVRTDTSASAGVEVLTVSRTNTMVHKNFSLPTLKNDLALLRLPRALNNLPTKVINLIRLPSLNDVTNTFAGSVVRVSGWGITADGGYVNPVLKWANVTVMDSASCAKVYGTSVITSSTICTSTSGGTIGTCNGDSGGPLIYLEADGQYTLVGVVSFVASTGCQSGPPDGFTRVTNYLGWISSITGIQIRKA